MEKILELELTSIENIEVNFLILYNDDYNTFEHVIYCLIKYLSYSSEAAEQVAYIVHYKGKCKIKEGLYNELKPYKNALIEQGLNVEIS